MKRLYLVRHAKSSWDDPGLHDSDRPLNKRGKRDAPFMGERLKKYHVVPDIIVSSPAKRALKTAKIIAKKINYPVKKIKTANIIYNGNSFDLLSFIRNTDEAVNEAMLFGHNPEITGLANYFSNKIIPNMPTCGILCVEFNTGSWKEVAAENGTVLFFDYPGKHRTV
ncbi:MAG TPA: histidine phosphatase family protein [Bacteroidetes bacterium]|nr:histidine phosphatase family protein [Bacteroidota bacterium]